MKKFNLRNIGMKSVMLAAVAMMVAAGSVKAEQWSFDKAHTSVAFSVKHMVVSNVRGEFTDFDGTINFDGKDVSNGSAEMTIKTASVSTNNERRDGHLKSADFFDVEKYPTMTFKSTKVVPGDGNKFQMVGDLTIKDVTKPVTFDCEYLGSVEAMGATKAGFSAETTINRKDFHINWSKTLDNGGLVAGDDVKISLEIEANKAAEKM